MSINRCTVTDLRKDLTNILKLVKDGYTVDIEQRGEVVARLVPPAHDVPKIYAKAPSEEDIESNRRIEQYVREAYLDLGETKRRDEARRELLSKINKKPRSYG